MKLDSRYIMEVPGEVATTLLGRAILSRLFVD